MKSNTVLTSLPILDDPVGHHEKTRELLMRLRVHPGIVDVGVEDPQVTGRPGRAHFTLEFCGADIVPRDWGTEERRVRRIVHE